MAAYFPRLNEKQIDTLSQIYLNIGTISLASLAIPALLDRFQAMMVVLGVSSTAFFWITAVWLKR